MRGHFPTVAGPEDDVPHGQVYVFGYHGQEKAHAARPHATGWREGWNGNSKWEGRRGLLEEGVSNKLSRECEPVGVGGFICVDGSHRLDKIRSFETDMHLAVSTLP